MKWAPTIENIVTITATGAVVLGLFYMGGGWLSLSGFVLLMNLNTPKKKEQLRMAEYITLLGAEEVSSAARTMSAAADRMNNAAAEIRSAVDRQEQIFEQFLAELRILTTQW